MAPPRDVPALVDGLVEEVLIRCPPDNPAGEIRPTSMAPPRRQVPVLVDDLVEEVLIRCPPDDPAVLVRAAIVCKDWRRVVSGSGFRRRFCELHRTAPMLGFLYYGGTPFCFEPTTSFRPRYASLEIGVQLVLDARHGRVLLSRFSSVSASEDLVVWDPVRGNLQVLPMPRLRYTCSSWTAALLCAATGGCDHLDCAQGPFCVVFVGTNNVELSVCTCIYSSVQGEWSQPTSRHRRSREDIMGNGASALVGNAFYFLFQLATGIVKYDLSTGEVSVIGLDHCCFYKQKMIVLTAAEEGQLGLASITHGSILVVWSREPCSNRDFPWLQYWVHTRIIELKALLPAEAFLVAPKVVGLADGVGVVIVRTHCGLFTVDTESSHARKIGNGLTDYDPIAYMNFHTPVLYTTSSSVGPRVFGSTASHTDGTHVLPSGLRGNSTAQ